MAERRYRMALAGLGGRTVAVLAVLMLVVAAAQRSGVKLDLSASRRFTIDPALVRIVGDLREPVSVVAIWKRENDGDLTAITGMLDDLAKRNPLFTIRRIDPDLQQPEYNRHGATYHDKTYPALYLCRGERAFKIPVTGATRLYLQRDLGGGLLALADAKPPGAHFIQGHGELAPDGGADGSDALIRALELGGFRTTIGGSTLAADEIAVLAGPTAPLGEVAIASLDRHLVDGGSLLVFADDRCPDDLAALLRRRGILLAGGVPREPEGLMDPQSPSAPPQVVVSRNHHAEIPDDFPYFNLQLGSETIHPQHPASAAVAQARQFLVSPWTTPVSLLPLDPAADPELLTLLGQRGLLPRWAEAPTPLLVTAPHDTWLVGRQEVPKVPGDLAERPSLPLAVACVYQPDERSARHGEQPRIAVWGSRQAVSNRTLTLSQYANQTFAVDLARWLANRGKSNPIPVAEIRAFQVVASERGLYLIMTLLVAVVPCLAIGGALLAFLHRR